MKSNRTAEIVKDIRDKMKPGSTFHSSTLTWAYGRTNHVSAAIKTAKEFGFIEVAYQGCAGPVWRRTSVAGNDLTKLI